MSSSFAPRFQVD